MQRSHNAGGRKAEGKNFVAAVREPQKGGRAEGRKGRRDKNFVAAVRELQSIIKNQNQPNR